MYRATDGLTVRTTVLPAGDQGIRKTLGAMQRLADQGSRDPEVRATVIRAIRTAGVGDHNFIGQLTAWFHFVRDSITFVNDPVSTEWLQTPRVTLEVRGGDCDDRAVLLAAGLKSIGIPAAFKVVASDPRRPGTLSHVYVEAHAFGRPVALDPTYQANRLGSEPPHISRTWMVNA